MTNLFIEDITYLTLDEYKDSGWTIKDDNDIKIFVRKAEQIIDDIIWSYWDKLDNTQNTIFPVLDERVPLGIKKACILITNCLYKNKDRLDFSKVIVSETRRWKSVSYDTKFKDKFKMLHSCNNEEIYLYLKPFIKIDKTKTSNFFRT